jgi:hypothetical protein
MSQNTWIEHFQHKLQGLSEAHQNSASSLSLLAYSLEQNHLTSEEYLHWAMAHFRLPRLQNRFFTESPPSLQLFTKWKSLYAWRPDCLPVAEWEGSLIVACLEPPQDFSSQQGCIFVLASFESLHDTWQTWNPENANAFAAAPLVATPAAVASESPEGIDLSLGKTIGKGAPKDSFSFEDLALEDAAAEIEKPESSFNEDVALDEEKSEGLEGLFENASVVKLQAQAAGEAVTPAPAANDVAPVLVATAADKTANKSLLAPIAEEISEVSDVSVISEDSGVFDTEEKTSMGPAPRESAAAVSTKSPDIPPPPQKSTHPAAAPRVIAGGKPTMAPVASGNFSLDKWKKKYTPEITQKVTQVLAQMKAHFEKTLILSIDDRESSLAAFAWDDSFKEVLDKNARIPLKTPSIFNIVAATQKPFHGYISINEVNEKFFEEWNFGIIPDHITITPIVVGEQLVGMVVGLAQKSAFNKATLTFAEKVSNEFSKQLTLLKVA